MSDGPLFSEGDPVFRRDTRDLGHVQANPVLDAGDYWYRVRFGQQTLQMLEEDLDPVDEQDESIESLATEGRWGTPDAFRCAMAIERIAATNRSTVYSYRSQRILFEPYQYKPLLRVLDSLDRRLLIADEVGLGKTIESGLILAELEARQHIDKVLIVCPSRLREKWREELNRKFGQDFEIYDKKAFTQYANRLRETPHRGRLRAVISMQTVRGAAVRELIEAEISSFDVVIVDEAHHARNPSTQTSEALRLLSQLSECMLLLTATPLHLGSQDLYTLLNALRPTEFREPRVFENDLKRHRGVIEAGLLVRTRELSHLPRVEELLIGILGNPATGVIADPMARQVVHRIQQKPPESAYDWIELERCIQDLHPLSSILTRTRKRDVQEHAAVRRAYVSKCDWTPEEDQCYQRLVRGARSDGWLSEKLTLGEIQRARQAASCLPAAVLAKYARSSSDAENADELSDLDTDDLKALGLVAGPRDAASPFLSAWDGPDSKYDTLLKILKGIHADHPNDKVIIFSFFKGTVKYLHDRLAQDGVVSLVIHGDIKSTPLQPENDLRGQRIEQFRTDPKIEVLISTEVGSEGLDFQFCHHLVNYDLPWNPMVVEQRIGRIDRFGQKSEVLYIHNLVVSGTVEDRILLRLYDRIGIFEESIGDLENILGDVVRDLQRDFLSGELTPEEADERVEKAQYAVSNRRMHLEDLEKNAGELFGHEEYIRSEMERIGRLGRFVSAHAILAVLRNFISSHHPDTGIWDDQDGVVAIRLTDSLRRNIQDAAREEGAFWRDRSRNDVLRITMDGEKAFDDSDVELVNVGHPLMKAAVSAIQPRLQTPAARAGRALLRRSADPDNEFVVGDYVIAVFAHTVSGIRTRRIMNPVAWSLGDQRLLQREHGERLLHLVTEFGEDPAGTNGTDSISKPVWEEINAEIRRRHRDLRAAENDENEALYARRRRLLDSEFEFKLSERKKRLATAERNQRSKNIIEAFRGQITKLETEHRDKSGRLDSQQKVTVALSEPLAVCLIHVDDSGGEW